ncbi:MAG: MFS transporter [Rhizobiaceae bacterium]|nr:MFS transporter [Rhizobiaceae bacterium]
MPFVSFLRDNARWIAGGFLLTFFSSYGQTFFIALSAGDIRSEYGLSHGQWGTLYMVATLASALTLPKFGQIVDRWSARTVTLIIVPVLAFACVMMALSQHIALLVITIYLLRLFGQGMMSQNAFTAIGRWFAAQRGKALSVTAIGVNAGEALFPTLFVFAAIAIGWRNSWLLVAASLIVVALPLISSLVAVERAPRSSEEADQRPATRDWTRGEALRDPYFYLILLGVMAPGFIGTTVFFHQVYLVELRGWSIEVFAATFMLSSTLTVISALIAGGLVDRYSAVRLLPTFLIPLGIACLILSAVEAQWSAFAFMGFMGLSYGVSSTLFGALWPEIYGTGYLGAIRAVTVAIMVFATAMGPGITGFLIDLGVSYPLQIGTMGAYCFFASGLMYFVSRSLTARSLQASRASATPQR